MHASDGSVDFLCLITYLNMCPDINECLTTNECQQECVNTEGNYKCSCNQGFNLNIDNRSCDGKCINYKTCHVWSHTLCILFTLTAVVVCPNNHGCSHGCAIVNGTQQCFCPKGFNLINTTQCNGQFQVDHYIPCFSSDIILNSSL